MMTILRWLFVALLMLSSPTFAATDELAPLRLASLEWSPYVGHALPEEGWVAAIVKAAAGAAHWRSEIAYFPWSRTLQEGLNNPEFAGYFPAFYLKEREKSCYFSHSLGNSVVGFASLSDKHFDWQSLSDLKGLTIGTVQDYANGEEFDTLVQQRLLKTDNAPSDLSNLRKLLIGRVDVIVIDQNVLRQLLITEPALSKVRQQIIFHAKALTTFSMHICFQHTPRGLILQKSFDNGLEKLNLKKMENLYFSNLLAAPNTVTLP
ncbi:MULTISPECIES: transporter substrate-binding domain-containing protein [unclassified Undibacterium]|uniref:substrate-binding periplasmic protein n=2 Tax=Undibacterium TaxID=401469 RepID=UPI002AC94085|nr:MULTISPECIES: transporter substrate-binding domain-containing protein [unclassified Undibacterium]MEB0216921.1 transporter substrate-binding domain-containing protein [Undibacterium sp. 5I2]MEB0138840.1 transporter substrate-binding domain-containing protein [Undibacterium sp. CCC2.1]MEB0172298.1 transporter substrate-binding domain-containing protein [Undibacterium sp. CCC1.1]MEB0176085.1 transporter substrate-binding domain-containing protein [Undibacterium sp. CCC3.4]WPX44772.1 transport